MTTPPSGIELMDVEDAGRVAKEEDGGDEKPLEKEGARARRMQATDFILGFFWKSRLCLVVHSVVKTL